MESCHKCIVCRHTGRMEMCRRTGRNEVCRNSTGHSRTLVMGLSVGNCLFGVPPAQFKHKSQHMSTT